MKKIVSILLTLFVASAMVLSVSAAESKNIKSDSNIISESTKTELGISKGERVEAIYNVPIRYAFTKYNNIDDILSSNIVLGICYRITSDNSSVTHKFYWNDKYENINDPYLINTEGLAAFHNSELIKVLSKDIKVENIYYLSGEVHHEGTAIYYVTNMGDFVYYTNSAFGDGKYLFPVNVFCKYQKAISDSIDPNSNGGINIAGVWDLSKYDMTSASFSPFSNNGNVAFGENNHIASNIDATKLKSMILWIGIPCMAALVILGVVFRVKKMRKG